MRTVKRARALPETTSKGACAKQRSEAALAQTALENAANPARFGGPIVVALASVAVAAGVARRFAFHVLRTSNPTYMRGRTLIALTAEDSHWLSIYELADVVLWVASGLCIVAFIAWRVLRPSRRNPWLE